MLDLGLLPILTLAAAILLLGIAKGGFGGVGAPVALPIMALVIPADLALGALLPILLAMDCVSVTAHRRAADSKAVLFALPAAVIGVLAGAALLASVPTDIVGIVIGLLAILFALMALTGFGLNISHWPRWTSGLFGGLSGLTSTLAHAGGPPIHIYFLSRGYAPAQFVATSAMFMAGVNVIKIVPFLVVGALNTQALTLALWLAPLALAAAYLGVWIARILPKPAFKLAVNGLLIVTGVKLIMDGLL
ncbi:sulfite exporter TauE/SafE family protein [Primorskyibacter sp. S187A]|uniref:sulfite exporter TauE/SafE family protein n=1 Tax=Primorskyibacter sp. S187A TaxID=3415130 RepID=UPI003C7B0915